MCEQAVLPVHKVGKAVCGCAVTTKGYARCGHAELRIAEKVRRLRGNAQGMRRVVRVHARYKRAARHGKACVKRRHNAAVGKVQSPQSVTATGGICPVFQKLAGVVG